MINRSILQILILSFLVTPIKLIPQTSELVNGIITKKTKFYKKPKLFSKKYRYDLSTGDTISLYGDSTDKYFKIEYNDQIGWIKHQAINIITPIAKTVKKEVKTKVAVPKTPKKEKLTEDKKQIITKTSIPPTKTNKQQKKVINKSVERAKTITPIAQPETKSLKLNDKVDSKKENQPPVWVFICTTVLFAGLLIWLFIIKLKMDKRYKPIIDIEEEVKKVSETLSKISKNYTTKKSTYDSLSTEVDKLSDDLEMMSNGLYDPKFSFDTSDQFKEKIKALRIHQKSLIREKKAVPANSNWTINDSKREGKKFINRQIRIALRAFNGECDAIISKVNWNNVDRMEQRIENSRNAIDKLLETSNMYISDAYVDAKVNELYATHEYTEKKHEELEEQRRIRAEEREEKKVLQEIEKARIAAETDERAFNIALEEAKTQMEVLSGAELKQKEDQIQHLEQQLKEALDKKERAISRAQLTKSGHVYVISNKGSFGERVYKIGLTRRLEPEIRVKELGDASVPFPFDIHAMIFSENAPSLEHKLHLKFEDKRVNLVNRRKEYFNLEVAEIKECVLSIDPNIDFISTVESREFRETKALIAQVQGELDSMIQKDEKFPESI